MSYLFLETNQETLDWIFAIIEKKTPLKSIKKIIDVL
jgi:hypothetical protein